MQVRIDREREERRVPAGWFARSVVPAYALRLTVRLTEEERFLIETTGLARQDFFQAPIPPDVTDPAEIERLKAGASGHFLVRDLFAFTSPTLIGLWPDVVATDAAEAALRGRLQDLADHISRSGGATEFSVEFEL